jgi:signal transduction protein with GAF and PtsI domain/anti-sigma regulatory factor (Ser/Thr protein kinase)
MSTSNQDITKVLAEVASAVVGQFEMNKLLEQIIDTTMKTLNAEVCSIYLLKKDDPGVIECVAGSGFAERIVGEAEYKLGEGLTGYVAKTGKAFNIKSRPELLEKKEQELKMDTSGKYDKKQFSAGQDEFRNLLALPLKIQDKTLGVIKAENKKDAKHFSEEDLRVFETITNVITLAIQNARLQEENEKQSRKISETLTSVADKFVGQFQPDILLKEIVNTTMGALNAEVCSIFLRKQDNPNVIEFVAGSGFAGQLAKGKKAEYEVGEGFTGSVAKHKELFHVKGGLKGFQDLEKEMGIKQIRKYDDRQWGKGKNLFRNLLALQLQIKGEMLGVIKAENKLSEGEDFSEEDETTFKTIANVTALAIENSRLYEVNAKQLKAISGRAAHRLGNQITNYDFMEFNLQRELEKTLLNKQKLEILLHDLQHTTLNVKRMIIQLKDYAKPIVLKKDSLNINSLIKQEVKTFKITKVTIDLNLDLDKNIPNCQLDSRVSESIKELLLNSKRAIEKTQQSGNINISSQITQDGKKIEVYFKDDGPGIPDGFPLFEAFRSTSADNTGLGLVTVRELMQAHGGNLEYKTPDKGACFKVTLPI